MMLAKRTPHSTRTGLVVLGASLVGSLLSLAWGYLWAIVLATGRFSPDTVGALHTFWIPLSGVLLQAAIAVLGLIGFLFVWDGRWELGPDYAARVGLALLAALVAVVAFALYGLTGILLGYVPTVGFLAPWHVLLALVGDVFLGFGLYGILANLPIAGGRPVAAVALALGLAGVALLSLVAFGLRRARIAGLDGAGFALSVVSLALWLTLCLWGGETLRSRGGKVTSGAATGGS